jgi:hypothetical protein
MFYPGGFQTIKESIFDMPDSGHWDLESDWRLFLVEFVWSVIFWSLINWWLI